MSTHTAPRIGWRRRWIPAHIRRRLLAALLAGAAAILALSSMHPSEPVAPATTPARTDPLVSGLGADEVAAPVRLIDPGVGALLRAGSFVDVLAAASSPTGSADDSQSPARVIAYGVRVLAVPAPSTSAAGGTGGSLVVLEVSRAEAQALAGAEAAGRLSVTLTRP